MRSIAWMLLVVASTNGCSCNHGAEKIGDGGAGGGGSDMSAVAGGDILITPSDATLDITSGGSPATACPHLRWERSRLRWLRTTQTAYMR